jgi:putative ABC transport system permease protein
MASELLNEIYSTLLDIWATLKEPNIWIRIALSIALLLMLIGMSYWQKTNLESKLVWSFLRGFIQIIIFGSFLTLIFGIQKMWIQFIILLLMCVFAAYTNYQSYPYPKIFLIGLLAITSSTMFVMSIVIFSGAIFAAIPNLPFEIEGIIPYPPTGEYIVPMGSMVVSSAMRMSGIALERSKSDIMKSRGRIEAALALGDSSRNTVKSILKDSYKASLTPTINRVATLGIVSIPGLMSGMIIGGLHPIKAAIYQVVIFLMLLSAAFIASITTNMIFTRQFFTKQQQLNLEFLNLLIHLEQEKKEKKKIRLKKREERRRKRKANQTK